jgi:hypothetical protein
MPVTQGNVLRYIADSDEGLIMRDGGGRSTMLRGRAGSRGSGSGTVHRVMAGALAVGTASALTLIGLAAPAAAAPTTWYVNSGSGDNGNNCTTATSPCLTIGAAVGKSSDGDTIRIAQGSYPEALAVDKSVTLVGSDGGSILTPPAGAAGGALVVGDTATVNVRLSRLVVQDNASGPGIRVSGASTVDIADSTSRRNAGPGLQVQDGSTVTVESSDLSGNDTGASVQGGSTLTISQGTTVNDNTESGVEALETSTVTVDTSVLKGNHQYGIALGLDDSVDGTPPSTAHVVSSTVSLTGDPESETLGAGIFIGNGDADVTDSTLSGNAVGLMDLAGRATVTGGTVEGNRDSGVAGFNLAVIAGGAGDVSVALTGTRITGNFLDGSGSCLSIGCGGGVMAIGGTVTATGVTIDSNSVGVMLAAGTLTMTDSTVRDNIAPPGDSTAFLGAGIAAVSLSADQEQELPTKVEVTGSTISGNTWGTLLLGATGVINRSTISGNSSLGVASGFPYSQQPTLAGTSGGLASLVGPVARVAAAAGTPSATKAQLAELPAALVDDIPSGAALITGSTIAGNGADPTDAEGAPVGQIATGPQAVVLLAGSVVSGPADVPACNQASLIDGPGVLDGGYNVVSDDSCRLDPDGTSLGSTDPRLGPLTDNGGPTLTMLPASGSPAVNLIPTGTQVGVPGATGPTGPTGPTGSAGAALSPGTAAALQQAAVLADGPDATVLCDTGVLDQRGVARPQGDACDSGAVERNVVTVTAGDATMEAGGRLPTVAPRYAGFYGGDGPTDIDTPPTCTADPATGTTNCSGAVDAFYDFVYVPGTLTVLPAVQIVTDSLPGGTVGTAYRVTLAATGGSGPPYRWSVTGGALPTGLTLHQDTGEISGTPTVSGSFTVQVKAADTLGSSPAKWFSVTIEAVPVTTTTSPTTSSSTVAPTSTSTSSSTSGSTTSAPMTTMSTPAPTSTGAGLADTGFQARSGLLVGGVALLLGIALVVAGRRRRDPGSHLG